MYRSFTVSCGQSLNFLLRGILLFIYFYLAAGFCKGASMFALIS